MRHWIFTGHDLTEIGGGFKCARCGATWGRKPTSNQCPGVTIYQWGKWPEHLLTKKQLADAGYSVGPKSMPKPAGAVWREKSPDGLMFLYDKNDSKLKKPVSDEVYQTRVEVGKQLAAQWKCKRCGGHLTRSMYRYGFCNDCADHLEMVEWSRHIRSILDEILVLDSETTGLDAGYNEIIQLAVLSGHGNVLLDTYVKALHPERIYEGTRMCAFDVHGIGPDKLTNAPTFPEIYEQLKPLLADKRVLIYNVGFDHGMLDAQAEMHGLQPLYAREWIDVMRPFAQWYGNRKRDGSYRWQKLNGGHSALEDCQAVLRLIDEMAELEKETTMQVISKGDVNP